jgi:phosphatidylglycerol phospholipase C
LQQRIVIGIWHHDFLARTQALFQDKYKICFIGLSLPAARRLMDRLDYLSVPFAALADDDGRCFIDEAHALHKRVFTWTINDVEQMACAVSWGVDGIVGDHVDVMVKHIHDQVTTATPEAYKDYIENASGVHLKHRRRRWYYYGVKKAMQWGSASYIGV